MQKIVLVFEGNALNENIAVHAIQAAVTVVIQETGLIIRQFTNTGGEAGENGCIDEDEQMLVEAEDTREIKIPEFLLNRSPRREKNH